MSFFETGLEKVTAVCVGTAAVALGAPPAGAIEASVGVGALIGFFLGRNQKFGPECRRVRGRLQEEVFKTYGHLVSGGDGNSSVQVDLIAANEALNESLERCVLDRAALAASAVSREGFPDRAVMIVMDGLGEANPGLFGAAQAGALPYRFARDVVRAGIKAAIENENYYRQLEPQLMFELAKAVGTIREDVIEIKQTVVDIRDRYHGEINLAKDRLHATESDLIAILSYILQKPIPREDVSTALENSYERLTALRESMGDLRSLANEAPEISALLQQADAALGSGERFSLDAAETALAEADQRYAEIIADRQETIKRDKENRARILGKRAELASVKFNYAGAVECYRVQSELLSDALGPEHPDTATSLNNFARNLNAQGRFREAEPLYRKALDIRERVMGAEHLETATSINNLALNLNALGRHGEAEPLHRKALEMYERRLGAEHSATAINLNNLAFTLNALGRYGEAEPLLSKALDIHEQVLGAEHLETAISLSNFALNLHAQGRYGEAEPLYRRALDIRERGLGAQHPDTATSLINLAYNLDAQRRHGEAEPFLRKSLDIYERMLGAEHPYTAICLNNLAHNLDSQGCYGEAEPLYRKALDIRERVLGPENTDTAVSLHNLALYLNDQGRYGEAEPLYRKALDLNERLLGADHPHTARFAENFAINQHAQGRHDVAEPLLRDALQTMRAKLGEEHDWTQRVKKNLAANLHLQGKDASGI